MNKKIIENWKFLKEEKKKRHAQWKNDNIQILVDNMGDRFEFRNDMETIIFRDKDYPQVDFYPSTGRWRIVGNEKSYTYSGGAEKFIEWYEKQKEK
jgi:hypothetical protein